MKKILLFFPALFSFSISNAQIVAAADYRSVFVCADGLVYGCGYGANGELGTGVSTISNIPVQAQVLNNIIGVAAGSEYTLYLKNDGTVWGSGINTIGELDTSQTLPFFLVPFQLPHLSGIVKIAAGDYHSLFLKNDGTVWASGDNQYGELGDGTTNARLSVYQIPSLSGIIDVKAGPDYSLFLKNDSTVWGCGHNQWQLGDSTYIDRWTPVQAHISGVKAIGAGYVSIFIKGDGTAWQNGTYNLNVTGITDVAAGINHVLLLKSNGTVLAFGVNIWGELGGGSLTVPVAIQNVIYIAVGDEHSLFVKSDGTAYSCGGNDYGQLGWGFFSSAGDAYPSADPVINLCPLPLAVAAKKNENTFLIYPNPSSGIFKIKSPQLQNSKVEIYNILGEKIYSAILNESEKEIELKNAAAGIYFVQVSDGEKMFTQKLVIE